MKLPGYTAEEALQVRGIRSGRRSPGSEDRQVQPQLRPKTAGWICDWIWECCEGGSFACCWYWMFNCTTEGTVAVSGGVLTR